MSLSNLAPLRAALRTLAAGVMTVLLVAGCGGGGGDDDDETSVSGTAVAVTPSTLVPPADGATSVDIGYSASMNTYPGVSTAAVSAYVSSATSTSSPTDPGNRVAVGSCSLFTSAFSACTTPCVFSAERVLSCGAGQRTLPAGSYILVGRVCVKNKSGNDV